MNKVLKGMSVLGFAMMVFVSAESKAGKVNYTGTCSTTTPLTSYERCDRNSTYGYSAYDCALNESLAQCETAGNLDCVEVAVRFSQFISQEFPGFKGCTSNVTVRGWR